MGARVKRVRKRLLFWLALSLCWLGIALVPSLEFWRGANGETASIDNTAVIAPTDYEPCLPRADIRSNTVVASVNYRGKTYIWNELIVRTRLDYNNRDGGVVEETRSLIIEVSEDGCSVIVPTEKATRYSLTFFLPVELADSLALASLKTLIARYGGKEQLIEAYEKVPRDGGSGPWIFFPEDVRAFRTLGMRLPKGSIEARSWEEVGY